MIFNFCDPRLRPQIHSTTINTEGYEITNLINNSGKGFLAYACIKPPVNIDITFLCNISINHILIWPQIGSQKSSGFQLYAKTSNDTNVPYTLMASGFLNQSDNGLLFYPSNVNHKEISVPVNFLKRYIKSSMSYLTTYVSSLRLCICKTENSVPALGKIEVWGLVSPRCGKDIVANISALWFKQEPSISKPEEEVKDSDSSVDIETHKEILESSLQVPECFLDAITYDIMTQPILLPSGKIIDQNTLLKHEETEALWGRRLTDPFTGLPFSEDRKPVIATTLKARIDKFLLENSNSQEVKSLPRVLGHAQSLDVTKKMQEIPKYLLKRNIITKSLNNTQSKIFTSTSSIREKEKLCHKLPVVISHKRKIPTLKKSAKRIMPASSCVKVCNEKEDEKNDCTDIIDLTIDDHTDFDINTVLPNLKRFNSIPSENEPSTSLRNCSCCFDDILYQLPCKHILCRKILMSIRNNQCTSCGMVYKTSEIERIYK